MSRPLHEHLDPFGLAVAAWVAATAVPAVALLGRWRFGWGVEALALLVLLGGPAVAAATWPLVPGGLATALAVRRLQPLAAVVPLGYLLVPVAALALDADPSSATVGLAILAAVAGLFAGLGVWAGADSRYAESLTDGAEVLATWSARPGPARRSRLRWLVAGLAVAGAGIVLAALLFEPSLLALLGGVAGGAIALHRHRDRPREFAATAAGLSIHVPGTATTRFLPWSRFRGFSRSAEALVLHRRWWPSVHCAVADLDDPDAVAYALERRLDRPGE